MTGQTAVVFPGQGSQRHGMGKDFYENVPLCREIYEEASDVLKWNVAEMCFGEDERLNLTEYAQPCILVTEIAMLRGIESVFGINHPKLFGGHSLGEYTALVASGTVPLSTVLRIVHIRGSLMQQAVPIGEGGMAAVIARDLPVDRIRSLICDLPIDVANINSANQVVISGQSKAMPEAEKRLMENLIGDQPLRFVPLNVSAPFHSRFMKAIAEPFEEALSEVKKIAKPENAVHVTSNFSGGFHSNRLEEIIDRLVDQLSGTVQWRNNMEALASRTDAIYEIGPNRPLRDFFKTIGVTCVSITTYSSAERAFNEN